MTAPPKERRAEGVVRVVLGAAQVRRATGRVGRPVVSDWIDSI